MSEKSSFDKDHRLEWNGNEIVFKSKPNEGVAGIAPNMPDEFAKELVNRWNNYEREQIGANSKGS